MRDSRTMSCQCCRSDLNAIENPYLGANVEVLQAA
jgi:hypothetical protein